MEEKEQGGRRSLGKKTYIGIGLICAALLAASILAVLMQRKSVLPDVPLRAPTGLMEGSDGFLYLTDSKDHNIVRMKDGKKEVVAGYTLPVDAHRTPAGGYQDGFAEEALFDSPFALVEWGDGIAVSDMGNHCLRLLLEDGTVHTLAGTGVEGCQNGMAYEATFSKPRGLAVGPDGCLYVADSGNGVIRRLTPDGHVDTPVGSLHTPSGLCWDGGILYITDTETNQILKYEDGQVETVAGVAYADEELGMTDGPANEAVFSNPLGIAASEGVIYVSDTGFSAVRQIKDGQVETLAGFEGTGNDLWPASPVGIVVREEELYVADAFAGVVFRVKK